MHSCHAGCVLRLSGELIFMCNNVHYASNSNTLICILFPVTWEFYSSFFVWSINLYKLFSYQKVYIIFILKIDLLSSRPSSSLAPLTESDFSIDFFRAGAASVCAHAVYTPESRGPHRGTSNDGALDVRHCKKCPARIHRVNNCECECWWWCSGWPQSAPPARAPRQPGGVAGSGAKCISRDGVRPLGYGLVPSHRDSRPSRPVSRAPPVLTMAETKKVCIVGSGNWWVQKCAGQRAFLGALGLRPPRSPGPAVTLAKVFYFGRASKQMTGPGRLLR